jgi:hypothetical protein
MDHKEYFMQIKVHFIIYRNVEEISRVIAPEKKVGAKI